MIGFGVKLFFSLNRLLGLAPFDMSLAVMAPKVASQTSSITLKLHQMMPTYVALCFYVMCLVSIFWQHNVSSQFSAAANWFQFVPNALAYIIGIYLAIKNRAVSARILTTFYYCDQKMEDALNVSFRMYNKKANYMSYFSAIGILQ